MQPAATLRVLVDVDSKAAAAGLTAFDTRLKSSEKLAKAHAATVTKQQQQLARLTPTVGKASTATQKLAGSTDQAAASSEKFADSVDQSTTSLVGQNRQLDLFNNNARSTIGAFAGIGDSAKKGRTEMDNLGKATDQVAQSSGKLGGTLDHMKTSFVSYGLHMDRISEQTGHFSENLLTLMEGTEKIRDFATVLKMPGIAAALGPAIAAVDALVGGSVALIGALEPLSGLTAGVGTLIGLFAQIKFTTQIAGFKGVTDAVGGLNEKLDKTDESYKQLTPAGQKFARTLNQMKQPLQDMQEAVQKPLFKGMTEGLKEVRPALGTVQKILTGTGQQLGKLAEMAGTVFGREGVREDLLKFGQANNEVLGRLGRTLITVARQLLGVMVAARPLTEWMSKLAAAWGQNFANMLKTKRESGELTRFFKETKEVASDLIAIFRNTFGALGNIIELGAPLGREIIDKLRLGSRALKEWTESAGGKNEIAEFFHEIRDPLMEAGKLLGAIVEAWFHLGKEGAPLLEPTLKMIRKDLLPLLVEVGEQTTKALGPELIALIGELAKHFLHLAGTSGPLTTWVKTMTELSRGLNWMFENVAGFQQVIITLLGFRAVGKAFGFAAGASGIGGFIKACKFLILPGTVNRIAEWSPMLQRTATSMGLLTTTTEGYTLSAKGATWATRALVSATVIGALVTAAIVIATNWEKTKEVFWTVIGALEDVWNWVKSHPFVLIVLGPIGAAIAGIAAAVQWVINNFDKVKTAATDVANKIADFAHAVGSVASSIANTVADVVAVVWEIGKAITLPGRTIVGIYIDIAKGIVNAIADIVEFLFPIAKKILEIVTWPGRTLVSFWVGVVKRVVGVIKGVIEFLWPIVKKIVEVITWPHRKIIGVFIDIAKAIIGKIRDAFNWIKDHVGPAVQWIRTAFNNAKDWIIEAFHNVKNFLSGVWGWIEDKANDVVGFFRDIPGKIGGIFEDVAHAIASPFKDAFQTVVDAAKFMLDKLLGGFSTALGALADIIGGIPEIEIFGEQITPDFSGIGDDIRGVQDDIDGFRESHLQAADDAKGSNDKISTSFKGSADTIAHTTDRSNQNVDGFSRNTKDKYKGAADDVEKNSAAIERSSDKHTKDAAAKGGKNAGDFHRNVGRHYERTATETGQSTSDIERNTDKDTKDAANKGTKHGQDFRKGLGGSYKSANSITADALTEIQNNTNKALKGLKVKPVNFGIKAPSSSEVEALHGVNGNQMGGLVHAQMGLKVPGRGAGDKVHMQAMVEPGERVFVLNRNASATLENLQRFNSEVPRFAAGGIVAAGKLAESMGMFVGEGPSGTPWGPTPTSGHADGSYHYSGEALDVSGGDMTAYFKAVFDRWMGHGLAELFYDPIGWYVKHDTKVPGAIGDHGDHVHVAITSAFGGAMAELVKQIILTGPKGPLLEGPQASVDLVREAANDFIRKYAPVEGGELLTGSGDVEKVFAEVSKKLSISKIATMALGEAGYAESGMQDLPGGDASSQGALQLLSSTASGMGINPHDEAAVSSAFYLKGYYGKGGANKLAASGLPPHLVAQGVQGSAFPSGSNYSAQAGPAKAWMGRYGLQRGGLVRMRNGGLLRGSGLAKLQGGGELFDPAAAEGVNVRGHGGEEPEIDLGTWFEQMVVQPPVDRMKAIIGGIGLRGDRISKWSDSYSTVLDMDEMATRAMALDQDMPIIDPTTGEETGSYVQYGYYGPSAGIGGLGDNSGPGGSGWLDQELVQLFLMRESMVAAIPVVQAMIDYVERKKDQMKHYREAAHRLETAAERAYNDLIRKIEDLERRLAALKREEPEGKEERQEHASRVRDLEDRIGALKDQIPAKQAWWDAAKFRVGATQQITDAFGGHVAVLDGAMQAIKMDGFPDAGKDGVPPLEEIQGRALEGSFQPFGGDTPPPPPALGGRIMELQIEIAEAIKAAGEAAAQAGGGAGGGGGESMSISELVQFASTVQLGAFAGQGIPGGGAVFAGGFATGGFIPAGSFGVVGEAGPELVSGPATVSPATSAPQGASMPTPMIFADIYIGGEKIEERVSAKVQAIRSADNLRFRARNVWR